MTFSRDGETLNAVEDVTVRLRPALSFRDANLEGFDKLLKGAKAGETKLQESRSRPRPRSRSSAGKKSTSRSNYST